MFVQGTVVLTRVWPPLHFQLQAATDATVSVHARVRGDMRLDDRQRCGGCCAASLTCCSAHSGVERQQLIWVSLLACVDGIALLAVVDAGLGRLRVLDTSETYVVKDDCRSQYFVRAHSSCRLVTASLNAV
jgi:hypothetical protein